MTVANTAQSEVTPATKSRLQPTKWDTPSPSPVMEPLIPQTVSSKRSTTKNKPTHLGMVSSLDYDGMDNLGHGQSGTLSE